MSERPVRLYLRPVRESRGLTQQALAEKAGCDRSYISLIENGSDLPSLLMLARFAQALDVQIRDLLDERPCPGCPYWDQGSVPSLQCTPVAAPALEAALEHQRGLGPTLRRCTTWLSALATGGLGTGGLLLVWLHG